MKEFRKFFESLNNTEKVICILQIITTLLVIVFSIFSFIDIYENALKFVVLFFGITLCLGCFVKFKKYKVLSILQFAVGVFAIFCFIYKYEISIEFMEVLFGIFLCLCCFVKFKEHIVLNILQFIAGVFLIVNYFLLNR
jgi:hypothetical protein